LDGKEYWTYNNKYFERDRVSQDWKDCPDIYSTEFPEEVKPFAII
jgi:hypothetical protein